MRLAPLFAIGLVAMAPVAAHGASASTSAPAPPPAATPSVTDVRCMVVSGVLAQSADPSVQSLGRAGLFYFSGRLEGRDDAANLAARVADVYAKMSADDVRAQIPICSAMFTSVTQTLQQIAAAFPSNGGGPPPAAPQPAQ